MPTRTEGSLKHQAEAGSLEPLAIFKDIEAQPPLMRPKVARAYRGVEGNWPLTFANAQEGRSGEARLYFNVEPRAIMKMVSGSVSLRKYPQLRRLEVGASVRVRGRIQKVDTFFIELEIRDLVFAKVAVAAHCSPRRL